MVLIGDAGVGKTSLVQRFCNLETGESSMATIGVEVNTSTINIFEKDIKMQFWGYSRTRIICKYDKKLLQRCSGSIF